MDDGGLEPGRVALESTPFITKTAGGRHPKTVWRDRGHRWGQGCSGGGAGNRKTLSFQNEASTLKADSDKDQDAVPEAQRQNPKQLVKGGETVASRERMGWGEGADSSRKLLLFSTNLAELFAVTRLIKIKAKNKEK